VLLDFLSSVAREYCEAALETHSLGMFLGLPLGQYSEVPVQCLDGQYDGPLPTDIPLATTTPYEWGAAIQVGGEVLMFFDIDALDPEAKTRWDFSYLRCDDEALLAEAVEVFDSIFD
jgi:hypothetical protein